MKILHNLSLLAGVLALSSCAVYGTPEAPQPKLPANWLYQSEGQNVSGKWWTSFNDPALEGLIAKALENAPDRRMALARVAEARALARGSNAALMPQLDATGGVARRDLGTGDSESVYEAGLLASWELDIFGKNLQRAYAAGSLEDAAIADERDTTLLLIAEIAQQYTLNKLYAHQAKLAEHTAEAQNGILRVTEARHKQGLEGNLELMRARSLQNTTRARSPLYRDLAAATAFQVDFLLGDMPGANADALTQKEEIPFLDVNVLMDAPADVIRRRPDIRAAESRLMAATSLSRAALAEIYPTVSLSGLFGFSSGVAGNLFDGDSNVWNAGGSLLAPLFHFGRIRAGINAAEAREEQAVIAFEQTVLRALRDIETAAQSYQKSKERYAILIEALTASKSALETARRQYTEGILSQLDVLEAEQSAFNADAAAVQAASDMTVGFITLCKALALQPE
jgi:multidrug efflux system outer membrane protein